MKSSAAGQMLGYSLQFPRALLYLLKGAAGDIISIEYLGDVSTEKNNGEVISEEDKSSLSGNPLANKSSNLWKTFYNWIKAVEDGELTLGKTKFILYCNHDVKEGIATCFSAASTPELSKQAIEFARNELSGITENHEVWKYYNYVLNEKVQCLERILPHFELIFNNGTGFEEIENEIKRMHFSESQIPFLTDELSGWLQKIIMERIKKNGDARVSWDEFSKHCKVLFERTRTRELIDFTLKIKPTKDEVGAQIKVRPRYIEQLDIINIDDSGVIEAVTDYLRANINRNEWIERGIIDDAVASDFQNKLVSFWKSTKEKISLLHKNYTEDEKGKLLFYECRERQETIRGHFPPQSTIAGTYHLLADGESRIGWHPNWEQIFCFENKEKKK
ncbi:MAG: hypothetical protein HEEMFOPI_02026 [Holosporales bacterium]